MAITRIYNSNNNNNLGYNNLTYYFDSDNKAKDGFRYVIRVVDNTTTLFEKTIIPDMDTGYCNLQINRELSDYLSYDFDEDSLTGTNNIDAKNSYKKFQLYIGEEYYYDWEWTEYIYCAPDSTYWDNGDDYSYNPGLRSRVGIHNGSNIEPNYIIGDTINIDVVYPGPQTVNLIGISKVIDKFYIGATISGNYVGWVLVLDKLWIGSGVSIGGGKVYYADNRKTRFSDLLNIKDQMVFNGVMSKKEWLSYDEDIFKMDINSSDVRFLTNLPYDGYVSRLDDFLYVNYLTNGVDNANQGEFLYFENDEGSITRKPMARNSWGVKQTSVGTNTTNFGSTISGDGIIIKPTTKWYKFWMSDNNGVRISKEYKILLDHSCGSIDSMKFVYMDKLGSFLPFNFEARNIENRNVNRSTYRRHLGNAGSNGYTYNMREGGEIIFNSNINISYDLSTGYLSNIQSEFFSELLESPITFIKVDGTYVRCNITTSSIQVKKTGWYEQKRYNIKVNLSNDEYTNY